MTSLHCEIKSESNNNDEISKGRIFNNYETPKGQIFTPQMLKDLFEERPQFVNVEEEIKTLVEIMTTKSRPFGKDITLEYQGLSDQNYGIL